MPKKISEQYCFITYKEVLEPFMQEVADLFTKYNYPRLEGMRTVCGAFTLQGFSESLFKEIYTSSALEEAALSILTYIRRHSKFKDTQIVLSEYQQFSRKFIEFMGAKEMYSFRSGTTGNIIRVFHLDHKTAFARHDELVEIYHKTHAESHKERSTPKPPNA